MARPKKIGLEYFPLDCQMDDKVEMLEAEHGLEGFAVYVKLLQACYQQEDGKLDMSIVFRWKTLGKQYGIPAENLRIIVDTMLTVGLFDRKVFEEEQKLTSNGIQKRLKDVSERRKKDRFRKSEGTSDFSEGIPAENDTKGKGKELSNDNSKKGKDLKKSKPSAANAAEGESSESSSKKKLQKPPQVAPDPPKLVHQFRLEIESRFKEYYWSAKDAKSAEQLIDKIRNGITKKSGSCTDEDVLKSFRWLLERCSGLTEYYQFTDVPNLNRKFNEIVTHIRANKKAESALAETGPGADLSGKQYSGGGFKRD